MPKINLLTVDELIKSLDKLEENMLPKWGKMNASQMMKHCSKFIDLYTGKIKLPFWYKIFGATIGKLFLVYISNKKPSETPRNLRTDKSIKIIEENLIFVDEKQILINKIKEISLIKSSINHPIYGKTDAEKIKFLILHHTMHHFNQFGLLQ